LGVCGVLHVPAHSRGRRSDSWPHDRPARRARSAHAFKRCSRGRARSACERERPSAFATLTALYGIHARGPITGITLFAGFASTLSWPLSSLLDDLAGWRGTCLVWAFESLPRITIEQISAHTRAPDAPKRRNRGFCRLEAAKGNVSCRFRVRGHLVRHRVNGGPFTETAGIGRSDAARGHHGRCPGGSRSSGRQTLRVCHPSQCPSARFSQAGRDAASDWYGRLAILGATGAVPFAVLYGAGNGLLTIARGTVPLAIFGPRAYGSVPA
jgi:hypothetical protein